LTVGRTPWTGDRPDATPPPIHKATQQKNADTHPCLGWDSNPRSQCSSGRRSIYVNRKLTELFKAFY